MSNYLLQLAPTTSFSKLQ